MKHNRDVLRATIEQLEKQIKIKSDLLSDSIADKDKLIREYGLSDDAHGGGSDYSEGEDDALRRQIHRYRVKATALDELVSLYRRSVMALYPDGSSYGAAQFSALHEASNNGGKGWIEREIHHVKKSYDEEIRVLDSEVDELRNKLRQNNVYTNQLRRQFEDSIKALYR